jgi:exosortase/archaeosortase family protein
VLHGLGIDVLQIDPPPIVRCARPERWGVDVANPCSGLRSLLAMTALTAVTPMSPSGRSWKQWLLFLSSIPLAIAGMWVRIIFIGLIAESFGERVAWASSTTTPAMSASPWPSC